MPIDLGLSRMCLKHKTYIKECPRCNTIGRVEKHAPNVHKISVEVPVYKKVFKSTNKYDGNGGLKDGSQSTE